MKDRYFLVVLCAVVCTVWSETESPDFINIENLNKSLEYCDVLTVEFTLYFSLNREELDGACRDMDLILQLYDGYIERCVTEKERKNILRWYSGLITSMNKQCHPGPDQEDYLLHALCIRQGDYVYEHCFHQYQQKTGKDSVELIIEDRSSAKKTSDEDDSDLRTRCCSFRDLMDCSQRILMEKCGQQTANYIEDQLNQIAFPLMQDDCKSYQCQDSSASRNFQRALLLPISLAMLSFYVLRST